MKLAESMAAITELAGKLTEPVRLMEVCGTHTMSAFRSGLRSLLPAEVSLLSGPGCPVCVTPNRYLDTALAIAGLADVQICTFGDMMRVPGSSDSLERLRARGGNIKVVYSPLDALAAARRQPQRRVVFLGVGFETTAPTVGWTIQQAAAENIANYSVLCAHKTMPQAMAALLDDPSLRVDGFLCPGHVSIITGSRIYDFICRDYRRPCVVAGFEPADMAEAVLMLLRQLSEARAEVEIQYRRAVEPTGNQAARKLLDDVFEPADSEWRGIGIIPGSGLAVRPKYQQHDAARVFAAIAVPAAVEHQGCRCGEVLRGAVPPTACPLFARTCTPSAPVGACMVSSEGTCAAYYRYAAAR